MFTKKKTLLIVVPLILIGLLLTAWASSNQNGEAHTCPTGFVSATLLEPIPEGGNNSKVISEWCVEKNEDPTSIQMLDPIDPSTHKIEDVQVDITDRNETVMGPSIGEGYRCVTLLEPIADGETESKVLGEVCSNQTINEIAGVDLNSAYLIAKFYDRTNYRTMLKEYFGPIPCSTGVSYGRNDLADDGLDNKFESGSAFSSCNAIEVFDFVNHTGATYACGANCSSFYALNNAVTSWRVKH
jgi:hypothetical protein